MSKIITDVVSSNQIAFLLLNVRSITSVKKFFFEISFLLPTTFPLFVEYWILNLPNYLLSFYFFGKFIFKYLNISAKQLFCNAKKKTRLFWNQFSVRFKEFELQTVVISTERNRIGTLCAFICALNIKWSIKSYKDLHFHGVYPYNKEMIQMETFFFQQKKSSVSLEWHWTRNSSW